MNMNPYHKRNFLIESEKMSHALSPAVLMVVIYMYIAIYHNFKENEQSYFVELLKLMDWTGITFIWQL